MSMQQARRANPYPWTWEIPAATGLGILLILIFGLHLGRSTANLLAGGGWQFTERSALFTSLPGLLSGDPTVGLAHPVSAAATTGTLWCCIVLAELCALLTIGLSARMGLGRWGPGRVMGMATAHEAEQLLGISRLRRNAPLIRPDLYGEPIR